MTTASSPKLAVTVTEWKPLQRNTLQGFATVRIGAMKLTIKDVSVHEQNGKRWVGLPAKAQIGRDQDLIRRDGKIQYSPVFSFDTKEIADAFPEGAEREFERDDFDRLKGMGALRAASGAKAAPEPLNKKAPVVANKAAPAVTTRSPVGQD